MSSTTDPHARGLYPFDVVDAPSSPEIDISDSEWCEIRESDDTDSLYSERDSDHNELASMPLSRRSSMSFGSSRDDEIDAWEGFSSDVSDEGPDRVIDPLEEQRVHAALDQSMVSTLSASRSNPSTTYNSVRDLRLSFPDPLSSSKNSLNRSFEDVVHSDARSMSFSPSPDSDTHVLPVAKGNVTTSPCEDPGPSPTPAVSHKESLEADSSVAVQPTFADADIDVVLYGASPPLKLAFIYDLLRKACLEDISFTIEPTSSPSLHISSNTPVTYAVYDRTDEFPNLDPVQSSRPSLGIVFHPHSPPSRLQRHTFYLPIFAKKPTYDDEIDYKALGMADHQHILPIRGQSLQIKEYTIDRLSSLKSQSVHDAFELLSIPMTTSLLLRNFANSILDQFNGKHAVTIATTTSTVCQPSPHSTFWNFFGGAPNVSATVPSAPSTSLSIRPVFAPTIFHRDSGAVSPPAVSSTRYLGADSTTAEIRMSTDVVVRSPTSISLNRVVEFIAPAFTHKFSLQESTIDPSSIPTTSLSLRIADSLAEFVDISRMALNEIQNDINELSDAIDDIMQAISRQKDKVIHDSSTNAQAIRNGLKYRNDIAKENALLLKEKGLQLMSFANDQLKDRAIHAKKKAHSLRESVLSSDIWRTCNDWRPHNEEEKETHMFRVF